MRRKNLLLAAALLGQLDQASSLRAYETNRIIGIHHTGRSAARLCNDVLVPLMSILGSVYLFRGSSNKKALPTDQPNMQNFELALRSDDSACAGTKKGVWQRGTRIGDAASFPFRCRGALSIVMTRPV